MHVQRREAFRVLSFYRAVSESIVTAVTGVTPVILLNRHGGFLCFWHKIAKVRSPDYVSCNGERRRSHFFLVEVDMIPRSVFQKRNKQTNKWTCFTHYFQILIVEKVELDRCGTEWQVVF